MYEKILAAICTATVVIGTIWFVCRRDSNRRTGGGTKSDTGRTGDYVKDAERRNNDIEAAERAAADVVRDQATTIGRTEQGNKDAQQLVSKAKHILNSAKHTGSNS